jgi:hypothetical protein
MDLGVKLFYGHQRHLTELLSTCLSKNWVELNGVDEISHDEDIAWNMERNRMLFSSSGIAKS